MPDAPLETTRLLAAMGDGDSRAADQLLPLVYRELRALAGRYFRGQRNDHTLQPTALVNEAFVKLVDQTGVQWNDRAHFFAVAATAMRQILINHAVKRAAAKRGGGRQRVSLDHAEPARPKGDVDLIALNDALTRLAALDERKHRIVEMRFFGGLSVEDAARVLGVSKTTVESEWRAARAWLNVELSK